MREILFRGKRVDNGEWFYGDILHNSNCVKIRENETDIDYIARSYQIIPETVGQYTGLKDLHGTRIFEGDVVTHKSYVVDVYYNNEYAGFYPFYDADSGAGYGVEAKNCEIIGNVYDGGAYD